MDNTINKTRLNVILFLFKILMVFDFFLDPSLIAFALLLSVNEEIIIFIFTI